MKDATGILVRIALHLYIVLGRMDVLTQLVFQHEHRIVLLICVFSFLHWYTFSVSWPFTSLVKFIARYFILTGEIVSQIVFSTSLSGSLLLVYGNAIDFCILILYPAICMNSFISTNSLLVR